MKQDRKNQDSVFYRRLERHHDELRWLYMELYDNDSMFAELCEQLHRFYGERKKKLKERDAEREEYSDWYKHNDLLGMMFYIDNFAGTISEVKKRLDRLEKIRRSEKVFDCRADVWTVDTADSSVLCIGRYFEGEKLLGIFNFSEYDKTVQIHGQDGVYMDLLSGQEKDVSEVEIPAYGFYYFYCYAVDKKRLWK